MRPSSVPTAAAPAFARFVAHAEALVDDPQAIADRLADLLAEDGWLAAEDRRPGTDSYRQHLLHVSPTRRFSIVALVWRPGQRTPIHDHIAWCVVGVLQGIERETRYRLVEDGTGRHLEPIDDVEAHRGHVEALIPPAEDIHLVEARGDDLTISIHVYGADIEQRGTSIHHRYDGVPELALAA
jgi:predicted metal-dependent enzyme (double-stranded beta helix superfamily)